MVDHIGSSTKSIPSSPTLPCLLCLRGWHQGRRDCNMKAGLCTTENLEKLIEGAGANTSIVAYEFDVEYAVRLRVRTMARRLPGGNAE